LPYDLFVGQLGVSTSDGDRGVALFVKKFIEI